MDPITRVKMQQLRSMIYRIDDLRKISRNLHGLDEAACNYRLTPQQESRKARLLKDAQELADSMGYQVYHQGDPRGCALYLIDETMNDTNYKNGLALC